MAKFTISTGSNPKAVKRLGERFTVSAKTRAIAAQKAARMIFPNVRGLAAWDVGGTRVYQCYVPGPDGRGVSSYGSNFFVEFY